MQSIFPVTLLAVLIAAILFQSVGCQKDDSSPTDNPLTPARNIEGTWKTAFNVTHYIKTDYCGFFGPLEDVATQKRIVTWLITPIDDNTVGIEVRYTGSSYTITNASCGNSTGYVPDVSPQFYKGTISSSALTIKNTLGDIKGNFSFTTNLMQGNWDDKWCMAYCQEVYTKNSELKFTKQ